MSLITAAHLNVAFGGRAILKDAGFHIGERDRVGLIGPNGSGKTTVMRLIMEEARADSGEIQVAKGVRLGYLPQDLAELPEGTVLQSVLSALPGKKEKEDLLLELEEALDRTDDPGQQTETARRISILHEELTHYELQFSRFEAERILSGLGFSESDMHRPLAEHSGGWRMRAALAALLFRKPDVLLMDEPTNHLDVPSVHWLDSFLKGWPHFLMMICHDREFLNRHIRRVLSFEPEGLRGYSGTYDDYLRARELERTTLENRARNLDRKVKEARKFIDRFRAKATKARQAQSKIKVVKKMELVETHKPRKTLQFSFPPVGRSGRVVLSLEGLTKSYGNGCLFRNAGASVLRGERVAVVGPNGCGKTTLLRIVAGEITPDSGNVSLGHNVEASHYAQHHTEDLNDNRTILEEVHGVDPTLSPTFVRGVCGAFLFSEDEVLKPVGVLSGGEKARVALAKLLIRPGNLMLMDEPTNHLDLFSSEALIQALEHYEGSLVFVSHNHSFVNRLATKVWDLSGTEIQEHPGNLKDYFDRMVPPDPFPGTDGNSETGNWDGAHGKRSRDERKSRKREEAQERIRRSRVLAPLKEQVAALESRLQHLEARQKEVSALLADEQVFKDPERSLPLMNEYGTLTEQIQRLMKEWEIRQLDLERAEQQLALDTGEP